MKPLGRILAVILGTIGCVVVLSAASFSWWATNEARAFSDKGFGKADTALRQLDQRCERLQGEFDRSFGDVFDLRKRLEDARERIVENQIRQTVSGIAVEIGPSVDRTEEFLQTLSGILGFLESEPGLLAALNARDLNGQARIDEILRQIESIRTEVGNFLNESEPKRSRNDLLALVKSILGKLEIIQNGLAGLRELMQNASMGLSERQHQVDVWIHRGNWVVIAICLWMFAGQFCLARHACRRPPRPSPPPPPPPKR